MHLHSPPVAQAHKPNTPNPVRMATANSKFRIFMVLSSNGYDASTGGLPSPVNMRHWFLGFFWFGAFLPRNLHDGKISISQGNLINTARQEGLSALIFSVLALMMPGHAALVVDQDRALPTVVPADADLLHARDFEADASAVSRNTTVYSAFHPHSARKASTGFNRAARRAGTTPAARPISTDATSAPMA